jgi:hypothetical protein
MEPRDSSRSHHLAALALVLLLGLPACGSDGGTGGNSGNGTTGATPVVTAARITVTQPSTAQLCLSPLNDFFFRLRLPIRFAESAGLGANVNFVRLSMLRGATEVERREVTASQLQALGAQRVNASATVNAVLGFDFNADPDTFDTVRLEFNFTDDNRNNSSQSWPDVTDLVLSLPFCTI